MDWIANLKESRSREAKPRLQPKPPDQMEGDNSLHQLGRPYLSKTGEFGVAGGLHTGPILDALLAVGASSEEVEMHIHPLGTPEQWRRWQEIKSKREVRNEQQ